MPLTQEQIDILLAGELNKPARGGKRAPKQVERTYEGWFSLHHKLMDEDDPNLPQLCENPNCQAPNSICAKPPGTDKFMCRRCFLAGYGTMIEGQMEL